ncbi:MAG: asparagine synthase (glutamine-hydrolyzing) [Acidobacteria bacterium]|nr:MAG: asparagine synthase (glutamine-hydrolyzing) [Acidobacteriota bacterium]
MCGICGIFLFDKIQRVNREVLSDMNRQIAHRGPDDDGFFVDGNVGLAMRRLSIIDIRTGHQPLSNEDGSIWIVFNGEIYNHGELRKDLVSRGHRYRTQSDTETIVHLYEEYGKNCVQYLRGMFAFAIWDRSRRSLFIARDRLGIKPLYYRHQDDTFLFGSEIKTILNYPHVRPEFNRGTLAEYLAFGYIAGEETMYAGINKLLPGHTLILEEDKRALQIEPYWDLNIQSDDGKRPYEHYVSEYRERLEDCVSSHLMSDVPLGVFLSGGLDSSAVAALTTKIRQEPIQTFSVGYGEQEFSELPYARTVAEHLRSRHHEIHVNWGDFFQTLPRLIWHEDEPVVWPSSVALYFVARLAREHVTVVLTGEGSDETLAGYTRYAWTLLNSRMDRVYRSMTPAGLRALLRSAIGLTPISAAYKRKLEHTFLGRDGASWPSFYFDNFYCAFSASDQDELLTPDAKESAGDPYAGSMHYWNGSSGDLLHRLLYTDIKTYLVELLMKQDQMSMAASIESRVPFLDHALVEFTATIPAKYSTKGMAGKCILKSAVADLLPEAIMSRKKMGFPTPWEYWLKGPQLEVLEQLLLEPRTLQRRLFRQEILQRLFAEHRSGARDHGSRIWRLLNLELWLRVCVDGDSGAGFVAQTSAVTHE